MSKVSVTGTHVDRSAPSSARAEVAWIRILNAVTVLAAIMLAWHAGAADAFGEPLATVSKRYTGYLMPDTSVLPVWGMLMLGLTLATVHQLLPTASGLRALRRMGLWWSLTVTLQLAWTTAFRADLYGVSVFLAGTTVLGVWYMGHRARQGYPHTLVDKLLLEWPVDALLAWAWAVFMANLFQYVNFLGIAAFRTSEKELAIGAMLVATFGSGMLAWVRGNWLCAVLTALVLRGIAGRYHGVPLVDAFATASAVGCLVGAVVGWWNSSPSRQ